MRPKTNRTIGPNMNFANFADRAGLNEFDSGFCVVERAPLVAHLSGELGFVFGLGGEFAALINRPAERLLNINVLVEVHSGESDRGMHVVGSSDDNAVDVLLLLEHFAIVGIALGFGEEVVFEMKDIVEASFGLGGVSSRHGLGRPGGIGMIDMLLEVGGIGIKTCEFLIGEAPVDIAERNDVLTGKINKIAATHAANADAGNVHGVAGGDETATENMAREDGEGGASNSSLGDKVAPRNFVRLLR